MSNRATRLALMAWMCITVTLSSGPARADLPVSSPACPPNSSCIPGTPPTPPGTCGPGNGGATCGGDGPATLGNGNGINVGAGNPINVLNGNKFQREVDMAPLPGTLGLEIVRYYNSTFSGPGASTNLVGRGWKLSYETTLYPTGRTLQIVQADGTRIIFSRDARDPSLCASANPANGTIAIRATARGDEYLWRWTNGRTLSFDAKGLLVQILAPNGRFVGLQHDTAGLLVKVTDPQGRSLNLAYLDKARARAGDAFRGVQSIASPVGRFTYHYGSPMPRGSRVAPSLLLANLVRVDMPTGQRYYHYEDGRFPTLLTGISELATDARGKLAWQRVSTYGYDADGKGALSVRGLPARWVRDARGQVATPARLVDGTGVDQVALDFGKGGQTTVTDAFGRRTVFRHAVIGGEYRLLEVRGAGCAHCGPTDVRYRYDGQGRLLETTTLDADGTPLAGMRTAFDARGRPLVTSRVDYRDGGAGAPQWQTRFDYVGDATQPARVIRPSVVAGKEAVVATTYAASGPAVGQPLSVRDDGFVPAVDAGRAVAPIARIVTYRYDADGERVEIDGPTPGDRTITEFDPATHLPLRVRHPGGRLEEVLERDAALRPRVVRISDGPVVRTVTMALNWRGQAERVDVSGEPSARYRYDVDGRLLAMNDGGGEIRFAYDAGGRMVARIGPDGTREPVRTAPDADGDGPPTLAAPQPGGTDRDWLGRPVAWRDGEHDIAALAGWGTPGTAAQASVVAIEAGDARAARLLDDFGRVVAIRNPDQGWQLARHDAGGRIVDSVDARGARQQAHWDAAGRLLQLVRYAPGSATAEQTLTVRYAGSLPIDRTIADADGTRLTHSDYDARGRLLSQTLTITPSGRPGGMPAHPVTLRHAWRYDHRGRIVARTFTDDAGAAFVLSDDGDAQGRTFRVATHGKLPDALGGGNVIAAAIDWTRLVSGPFASRIVHGDGTGDTFDVPQPAATPASNDRTAGVAMPDGRVLRHSPGRDVDAAGLPAAIAAGGIESRLAWNAAGQLARSVRADGATRYLYDAQGQRVARIVVDARGRATATLFFYDDRRLVAETDAEGRMQYGYAYLGWRPLAQLDLRAQSGWRAVKRWLFGAPVRHLHTDDAGRVTAMTQDGADVWHDDADDAPVLRRARLTLATVHQPLRYVGQYHDDDSGLAYHGARYFDPGSGRFLSPDPQGIADATHSVPAPLLLDLYAYAGGRPDLFFDPDGAARIRYFAITVTGAADKSLGLDQGFTKARWAFIVDNVQAGGDGSALGQKRNQYAQAGTDVLVDMNGSFFSAGQSSAVWDGSTGIPDMFTKHYGDNLLSIPEFTVAMSDNDATTLIASYIDSDRQALFGKACPLRANLLPQIKFAQGDPNISITNPTANGAHKERILACGDGSASNLEQRRISKYEAAAEGNETGGINRDCSTTGCPGIGYYCDATKCYSPRDQLLHGAPDTNEPVYTPSYGRSQFIGSTFVSELLSGYESFTTAELTQLGLTPQIRQQLRTAASRGTNMEVWWKNTSAAANFAAANRSWADLPANKKQQFTAQTGLGERAYIDMVRIKTQPPRNSKGEDLSNDATQAIVTSAIMSDGAIKTFLMGLFENFDQFTTLSRALMHKNLNKALAYSPNASEEYLAAMVARAHNGGRFDRPMAALISHDPYSYVQNFLSTGPGHLGKGDWRSLRCTENFGKNTVRPGTQGKGIGGLQIDPLKLR